MALTPVFMALTPPCSWHSPPRVYGTHPPCLWHSPPVFMALTPPCLWHSPPVFMVLTPPCSWHTHPPCISAVRWPVWGVDSRLVGDGGPVSQPVVGGQFECRSHRVGNESGQYKTDRCLADVSEVDVGGNCSQLLLLLLNQGSSLLVPHSLLCSRGQIIIIYKTVIPYMLLKHVI